MRLEKLDHLLSRLRDRIFTRLDMPLPLRFRRGLPEERAGIIGQDPAGWDRVGPELSWGEPESYFWFATGFALPEAAAGRRIYLRVDAQFGNTRGRSDPQCLVRVNGTIAQGVDGNHRELLLTEAGEPGTHYDILLEAGTIEDRRQHGMTMSLMVHDPLVEKVFYDLSVPLNVARLLAADDPRRHFIVTRVDAALRCVDFRPGDAARFAASLEQAEQIAAEIYAAQDFEKKPVITVTGHTHIDVAWLWRIRETRQKMARSMSTALALMEQYPDYRFMYNQGVLLDYLSEDYPEIFARLKEQVAAGRFEIEGALWLEPDANITNGESFVRHILHGFAYHEQTFGVSPRIFWLPDTFGYSAALPQLMKLSGVDVFITHKLSWNDTNRMPNETFHWEGIDGSTVAAYFLTTQPYTATGFGTTYCPDIKPTHVMGTWRRHGQQELNDELFLVYGHGDGGGGPTREMLENIRRMEKGIPGCPSVRHEHMRPFFERLLRRMADRPDDFPTWVGELYLEYHRGTLTSVAKNKRNNRLAEQALRELEALAVLARERLGLAYPTAELHALWRIVLLNQFHDILPGSSIGAVFDDSDRDYDDFFARASALRDQLAGGFAPVGEHVLFNTLGRPRDGLLELEADGPLEVSVGETSLSTQAAHSPDGAIRQVVPIRALPPLSATPVTLKPGSAASGNSGLKVSERLLENDAISVRFDEKGRIVSLFDKKIGRDLIVPGTLSNRLQAYRDMPVEYDAWDIDESFEDQVWDIDELVSARVVETGPYRAAIRFEWRYERSRLVQVVSLEAGSRRLDFDSFIDWHEHDTLIKAAFPLDLLVRESIAEIQFGHVRRPAHRNTSWDRARFETVMHRWVDVSEPGFGAAFLNDSKYGYDLKGGTMRLTLLKSPTYPWPEADQGEHRFRYSLRVHEGLAEDDIPGEAEAFNLPLRLVAGTSGRGSQVASLLKVEGTGVTLEALKLGEDGEGIVARLWETHGRATQALLHLPPGTVSADLVNLLERSPTPLEIVDGTVRLVFAPFQIVTVKLGR
ncbi:alpha-mannosidase [Youhaiella tibetensis]|uniref:Alpha-mannosidase n=1 Tax=Paradevosia tibetensis TaxID=1447062 RepID=A0A5B9DUR0_9HYPH|nr:glycoside hydrolase family 38 C-terminal domain-containing protein [Youhaiella tibetensis]QEE22094.1 alpha-mannosidase [Youhaiella tibetensis]GGF45426.1 alpha-mannosidase [Youhaiella tibetensis]